jgi:hypothetical protein
MGLQKSERKKTEIGDERNGFADERNGGFAEEEDRMGLQMREMVVLQRKKTEIGEEEDERVAGERKKI